MRSELVVSSLFVISTTVSQAQFIAPLPQPLTSRDVQREDHREAFIGSLPTAEKDSLVTKTLSSESFEKRRNEFCGEFPERIGVACVDALGSQEAAAVADSSSPITRFHLRPRLPFTHSRAQLASYLIRSRASTGLSVFSQFAANVSDNEALVVSNVIRGLAGRAIFSVDYAAVVTKAEGENQREREDLATDKSTIIRMVNNGGTLVGRFYAPVFVTSGETVSSTGGVHLGGGLIGSVGRTETLHAAGSAVGELVSSISITDLGGPEKQTAELIVGTRLGYSRSDAPLIHAGRERGVGFGQFAIGLRRNGELSLSVLVTKTTQSQFQKLVPRLQVNLSALR